MTTTMPKGTRVMLVARGNINAVLPIAAAAFTDVPVSGLAQMAAQAIIKLQATEPGRASTPVEINDTPLALKLGDRDKPLEPHLPLSMQTEGRWEFRDVPVQAQSDTTARLPVCWFDLIDAKRETIAA